jgi:hypothetical protein
VLNPHTANGIEHGLARMDEMLVSEATEFMLTGCILKKSALVKGRKLYQSALDIFKGSALIRRLELVQEDALNDLMKTLIASNEQISDTWSDLSGLLVPDSELSKLLISIEKGKCYSISELEDSWEMLYRSYPEFAWQSVLQALSKEWGKPTSKMQVADFLPLIDVWENALTAVYKQMQSDADLELSMMQRFGSGEKRPDHPFLKVLQKLIDEIPLKAARSKKILSRISE